MLRDLQSFIINVNGMNKAARDIKRGTFVNKAEATKTFDLATDVDDVYVLDRDTKVTKSVAIGEEISDYDDDQELVTAGEFGQLIKLQKGVRKATSEYVGADADLVADNYLTIETTAGDNQGKLIASPSNAKTNIKSLGYYMDANAHKLLAFEIV